MGIPSGDSGSWLKAFPINREGFLLLKYWIRDEQVARFCHRHSFDRIRQKFSLISIRNVSLSIILQLIVAS